MLFARMQVFWPWLMRVAWVQAPATDQLLQSSTAEIALKQVQAVNGRIALSSSAEYDGVVQQLLLLLLLLLH
jgi:hypothetical protein